MQPTKEGESVLPPARGRTHAAGLRKRPADPGGPPLVTGLGPPLVTGVGPPLVMRPRSLTLDETPLDAPDALSHLHDPLPTMMEPYPQ